MRGISNHATTFKKHLTTRLPRPNLRLMERRPPVMLGLVNPGLMNLRRADLRPSGEEG
jgi:hypothetical protein